MNRVFRSYNCFKGAGFKIEDEIKVAVQRGLEFHLSELISSCD